MTDYTITDILVNEADDFNFTLTFTYKGKQVQVNGVPREGVTIDKLKALAVSEIELFDKKRNDDDYQSIKDTFNGKSKLIISG